MLNPADDTHSVGAKKQAQCGNSKIFLPLKRCTDLSSLIGNFDCRYSTVLKFCNFPATLILHEINFG